MAKKQKDKVDNSDLELDHLRNSRKRTGQELVIAEDHRTVSQSISLEKAGMHTPQTFSVTTHNESLLSVTQDGKTVASFQEKEDGTLQMTVSKEFVQKFLEAHKELNLGDLKEDGENYVFDISNLKLTKSGNLDAGEVRANNTAFAIMFSALGTQIRDSLGNKAIQANTDKPFDITISTDFIKHALQEKNGCSMSMEEPIFSAIMISRIHLARESFKYGKSASVHFDPKKEFGPHKHNRDEREEADPKEKIMLHSIPIFREGQDPKNPEYLSIMERNGKTYLYVQTRNAQNQLTSPQFYEIRSVSLHADGQTNSEGLCFELEGTRKTRIVLKMDNSSTLTSRTNRETLEELSKILSREAAKDEVTQEAPMTKYGFHVHHSLPNETIDEVANLGNVRELEKTADDQVLDHSVTKEEVYHSETYRKEDDGAAFVEEVPAEEEPVEEEITEEEPVEEDELTEEEPVEEDEPSEEDEPVEEEITEEEPVEEDEPSEEDEPVEDLWDDDEITEDEIAEEDKSEDPTLDDYELIDEEDEAAKDRAAVVDLPRDRKPSADDEAAKDKSAKDRAAVVDLPRDPEPEDESEDPADGSPAPEPVAPDATGDGAPTPDPVAPVGPPTPDPVAPDAAAVPPSTSTSTGGSTSTGSGSKGKEAPSSDPVKPKDRWKDLQINPPNTDLTKTLVGLFMINMLIMIMIPIPLFVSIIPIVLGFGIIANEIIHPINTTKKIINWAHHRQDRKAEKQKLKNSMKELHATEDKKKLEWKIYKITKKIEALDFLIGSYSSYRDRIEENPKAFMKKHRGKNVEECIKEAKHDKLLLETKIMILKEKHEQKIAKEKEKSKRKISKEIAKETEKAKRKERGRIDKGLKPYVMSTDASSSTSRTKTPRETSPSAERDLSAGGRER